MDTHLCNNLFKASKKNHPECIKILFSNGADPNKKDNFGYIPLHYASWYAFNECVIILIKAGSHVNSRSNGGWTPLFKATRRGHVNTIITLIDNGADITIKSNNGWNLSDIAKTDEIKALVENIPCIKEPGED
jgi:ankyrin repeat protein